MDVFFFNDIIIIVSSYDDERAYIYLVNRSGLILLETIDNAKANVGIDYLGTIVYAYFQDSQIKIAILGGEVIYSEPADESYVFFQQIEDKVYITHNKGIICVQPQTTNNYCSLFDSLGGIAGIVNNEVLFDNMTNFSGTENKRGMLQTSYNSFGKDGSTDKKLIDIDIQCIGTTDVDVSLVKDHLTDETNYTDDMDYSFRNLGIKVDGQADALESITVDFEPQFNKEPVWIFTTAIHPNVLTTDGDKFDPLLTHEIIEYFRAQPSDTEYTFYDIKGDDHQVILEKIQTRGIPSVNEENDELDRNAYLATFFLRKKS